jgi:hypothetical protein
MVASYLAMSFFRITCVHVVLILSVMVLIILEESVEIEIRQR